MHTDYNPGNRIYKHQNLIKIDTSEICYVIFE